MWIGDWIKIIWLMLMKLFSCLIFRNCSSCATKSFISISQRDFDSISDAHLFIISTTCQGLQSLGHHWCKLSFDIRGESLLHLFLFFLFIYMYMYFYFLSTVSHLLVVFLYIILLVLFVISSLKKNMNPAPIHFLWYCNIELTMREH